MQKKPFLVTGANSGLGFECSLALARQENTHAILAGRSKERINSVDKVKAEAAPTSVVEGLVVGLTSLAAVRHSSSATFSFSRSSATRTAVPSEGNDVGHLRNHARRQPHRALPASRRPERANEAHCGAQLRDSRSSGEQVHDQTRYARRRRAGDGQGAFQRSAHVLDQKLCNLLFAKEFVRRILAGPEIIAYTLGYMPSTELGRETSFVLRLVVLNFVVPIVNWLSGGRNSTPQYSGGVLARLASDDSWAAHGWKRGDYVRVDEIWPASEQACEPELGS